MESNQFTVIKLGAFLLGYAGCLLFSILFNFPYLFFLAGFPPVYAYAIVGSAVASLAAACIWPVPKQEIEQEIREKKLHILWWISSFFLSTFLLYQLVMISGWVGPGNVGVLILAAVTTPVSQALLRYATIRHTRYLPEILAIAIGLSMMVPGSLLQSLYVIGFMCSYAAYLYSKHFLDDYLQSQNIVSGMKPIAPVSPCGRNSVSPPEWWIGDLQPPRSSRFPAALDIRSIWMQRLEIAAVTVVCIMMFLCGMITTLQPYVLWVLPVVMVLSTLLMSGSYVLVHYGLRNVADDNYTKPLNLLLFNIGFVLACIAFVAFMLQYKLPYWYAIRAVECIQWSQFIPQLAVFDLMVMCALYYMVEEYKVDKQTLCIIFCGIALGGTLINICCPSLLFLFTPEVHMGSLLFMCASTLFLSSFCNAFTYDGLTSGQGAGTIGRAESPVKSGRFSVSDYELPSLKEEEPPTSPDHRGWFRCF